MHITEDILQEMTDKIVREVNPRKVILFGSHVRGAAAPTQTSIFWWLRMVLSMPSEAAALK